jgi:redox-sensitive bicupin YhaK (pirin superfamily)
MEEGVDREIKRIIPSIPVIEGAGVRLRRVFGHAEVPTFDPFLLLDDFHSDSPKDYLAGFPWHPHRGIETVTYMIHGVVEHRDSLGNRGTIQAGDLQWMTAGSGIIHQEMPEGKEGLMWGLQLWVNLPASQKLMSPRYQDIVAQDIPVHRSDDGIEVKVISGRYRDCVGPVKDIICNTEYLDIAIPAEKTFAHRVPRDHTLFAYILIGTGNFSADQPELVSSEHLVLYGEGEQVKITAAGEGLRFLLISGRPLGEPVAWYGPLVMNTQDELEKAFEEYRNGTFLKILD